jgi:hypothetical protein
VVGAQLTLTIASGPDAGPLPSATTDANGNATVTLRGTKLGTDVVRASAAGGLLRSNDALATWTAPSPCSVAQTN